MRLWMGSELTRSETSRCSEIYPYIKTAPNAEMRWGRFYTAYPLKNTCHTKPLYNIRQTCYNGNEIQKKEGCP